MFIKTFVIYNYLQLPTLKTTVSMIFKYAKYKMLEPKGYIICNSTCMAFWKSQSYSIELLNPEGRWILPKGTLWGCPWIYAFVKTNRIVHLAELFQIPKDDAVKVLHSICQQIWKTQRWPQDWKRSVFIPVPKKGNTKECSNYCTIVLISQTSKVMFKILQASLQQYMNQELPDV